MVLKLKSRQIYLHTSQFEGAEYESDIGKDFKDFISKIQFGEICFKIKVS